MRRRIGLLRGAGVVFVFRRTRAKQGLWRTVPLRWRFDLSMFAFPTWDERKAGSSPLLALAPFSATNQKNLRRILALWQLRVRFFFSSLLAPFPLLPV